MDPFSVLGVTASIIACIQLTGTLLKHVGPSSHGRADLNRILQVVSGFNGAYKGLKLSLEFNETDHTRLSTLQHLEGPLRDSKVALELLHNRLENMGRLGQYIIGSTWDGKLKNCLKRLEDSKALFELAMHADQQKILIAIESYVRNAAEDIRDVKDVVADGKSRLELLDQSARENHNEAKEILSQTTDYIRKVSLQIQEERTHHERKESDDAKQKFIQWLSTIDPMADHNTAYMKHQPETGMWFIQGREFIEWGRRPGSSLWLNGKPGCGKSVLCATIIEELRSYCSVDRSRSLAFFYFSFNDSKKQQADNMLRSLIAQLASQSQELYPSMKELHQKHYPGQPPVDALMITLRSILEQEGERYIIIDALDECPSLDGKRSQLCTLLQEISSWSLPHFHLLTLSRLEPDIEESFSQVSSISSLSIQNARVDADIKLFVEAQMVKIPRLARWSPQLKEEIGKALVEGAHGMFRWAYCQIDALQKCLTPNALRQALTVLPKSLDDTYDRILQSIDPDYRIYTIAALRWLIYSKRPLFLSELAEAAVIRPEAQVPFDIEDRFACPEDILRVLSGLVIIQERETLSYDERFYAAGYDDDPSPIIRLAHFSVKEYLTSSRILNGHASLFSMDESLSRRVILESCLHYWDHYSHTRAGVFDEYDIDDFPLLSYACDWEFHARPPLLPSSIDLVCKCLTRKRWLSTWMSAGQAWHERFEEWVDYNQRDWATAFDEFLEDDQAVLNVALYLATDSDLSPILQPLMKLGADPNQSINVAKEFPIIVACFRGYYEIVHKLIQAGANVNVITQDQESALHEALAMQNPAIAQLLFDNGFDVTMGAEGLTDPRNSPLITAICWNRTMIPILLDKGAIFNKSAVRQLLGSPSGLDEESKLLSAELFHVSAENHGELLKLLFRVNDIVMKKRQAIFDILGRHQRISLPQFSVEDTDS